MQFQPQTIPVKAGALSIAHKRTQALLHHANTRYTTRYPSKKTNLITILHCDSTSHIAKAGISQISIKALLAKWLSVQNQLPLNYRCLNVSACHDAIRCLQAQDSVLTAPIEHVVHS